MGRVGVITHRERHDGGFAIVHIKDAIDNSFATRESNVFIIGKEKPWISLPKGKGVKVSYKAGLTCGAFMLIMLFSFLLPRREIVVVLWPSTEKHALWRFSRDHLILNLVGYQVFPDPNLAIQIVRYDEEIKAAKMEEAEAIIERPVVFASCKQLTEQYEKSNPLCPLSRHRDHVSCLQELHALFSDTYPIQASHAFLAPFPLARFLISPKSPETVAIRLTQRKAEPPILPQPMSL